MNIPIPLPFDTRSPDLYEQHPVGILFERMERRFGKTCMRLKVKRNALRGLRMLLKV